MGKSDEQKRLAREREKQVVELRLQGLDFDTIAEVVGYADSSGAVRAFQRVVDTRLPKEKADHVRRIELERLDAKWRELEALLERDGLKATTIATITVAQLRIMDQRAKYLGLYQPLGVELKTEEDAVVILPGSHLESILTKFAEYTAKTDEDDDLPEAIEP